MRMRLVAVFVLCIGGTTLGVHGQTDTAATLLETARRLEIVDGDLPGAIRQYQAVVDRFARNDRAAAARALLRIGELYEKLGDPRAADTFAQVVREFADNPAVVAAASRRLPTTAVAAATATSLRMISSSEDVIQAFGTTSADGRKLLFSEARQGHLVLRDLANGSSRLLTNASCCYETSAAAISRDGARVVFNYSEAPQQWDLRIASLRGSGLPTSRLLLAGRDIGVIYPQDWSPDGASVAVVVQRSDRTFQIGLVSVETGALNVLKSLDWRRPSKMFFSPDSRYLAFDLPVGEPTDPPDVFIITADGRREVPVAPSGSIDRVMGWAPNGREVLLASNRNGQMDLLGVPVAEGAPSGPARLLKSAIGNVQSFGVDTSGTLHLGSTVRTADIEIASIDRGTGLRIAEPVRPIANFIGTNSMPAWSPDGTLLAYASVRPDGSVLVVRSMTSDVSTELKPGMRYFSSLSWAPDGRSFAVAGADAESGRQGIYRVNATTGAMAPLVVTPTGQAFVTYGPQWSPDGTKIYFRRNLPEGGRGFYELDLATGNEREIVRGRLGALTVSPDGRSIATTDQWTDRTGNSYAVLLISVDDGSTRELLRVPSPQSFTVSPLRWAPDGSGIYVRKMLADNGAAGFGPSELLFVPVSGAPPRRLDVDATYAIADYTGIAVHPDGQRLAFVSGRVTHQLWRLEYFLPGVAAR